MKAVFLGIVQGLTEFLPISSSGHLVIGSEVLNYAGQSIAFDVFLHLGTLLAVVIVFRREIYAMAISPFLYLWGSKDKEVRENLLWCCYIVAATVPAVIVGLFFKEKIEANFHSLALVFTMLAVTGCLMIGSRHLRYTGRQLGLFHAVVIGCAQAMAILPGLSRSGSTIFAGMSLGIDRELVARFSFIMSIPAILGAVVLQSGTLLSNPPAADALLQIGAGTAASAFSGYFAIVLLLDIVKKNRLQWFGYYCLLLSGAGFVYLIAG